MKNLIYLSIVALFILSCQGEPTKTIDLKEEPVNLDHEKSLVLPWSVQMNDSTQVMEIRRDPNADTNNLQPEDMVDALNLKYPQIILSWNKQEGDKAFVSIADATYLTQQSGSGGAEAYLAEATYSLTEIAGIAVVEFSFKEGDHARPGIYTREDFKF
ncbi:MAG: hypothetical protein ACO1NS_06860 [Daejeonella sp.]|uniref:hypothetical protein n=1 Tax=Daejeonella sp. JGW-45 TaxID=3034148 RepID=UPI0023EADFE4|nr:hypothetical protein [Daejeonella sp. JGW-45]